MIFAGANGRITYSISAGNIDDSFEISETGAISTKRALDRETTPSFILTVEASDQGTPKALSSTVQVC